MTQQAETKAAARPGHNVERGEARGAAPTVTPSSVAASAAAPEEATAKPTQRDCAALAKKKPAAAATFAAQVPPLLNLPVPHCLTYSASRRSPTGAWSCASASTDARSSESRPWVAGG